MSKLLRKFSHFNKPFVLMGDYNIDKQNLENKVADYLNTLYSAGSYSLINTPIRITPTSATILEHIYCNSLQKISERGILISDLSDHLGTFCVVTSNILKNYSNALRLGI